jgi:hypothetical protein
MSRYGSITAAALLLAAACTAGAWQGWALGQYLGGIRALEPALVDTRYASQYAGDGAASSGFNRGFYGWSYLMASPVATPLATARTTVLDDPR